MRAGNFATGPPIFAPIVPRPGWFSSALGWCNRPILPLSESVDIKFQMWLVAVGAAGAVGLRRQSSGQHADVVDDHKIAGAEVRQRPGIGPSTFAFVHRLDEGFQDGPGHPQLGLDRGVRAIASTR